jgi:hypothetical protein
MISIYSNIDAILNNDNKKIAGIAERMISIAERYISLSEPTNNEEQDDLYIDLISYIGILQTDDRNAAVIMKWHLKDKYNIDISLRR